MRSTLSSIMLHFLHLGLETATAIIFFVGLNLVQLPGIFLTQMINAL